MTQALMDGVLNELELCDESFSALTGTEEYEIHFSKCGEQKQIFQVTINPAKCDNTLKFRFTVGCEQEVEIGVGLWQFELFADSTSIYQGAVMVNKIRTSLSEIECKT